MVWKGTAYGYEFVNSRYKLPDPDYYYCDHVEGLKYSGNSMIARCPFHDDRHQSLKISESGYYSCFACGEKGSMIDFHMKMNNLEFKSALKELERY
jgi:DNA primase